MDFSDWPLWATILRRVVTLLVLAAFGLHAFVQYRRRRERLLGPQSMLFLFFSVVFLFGAVANFVAAVIAVAYDMKQGPFSFGVFSVLVCVTYLIFASGVGARNRL